MFVGPLAQAISTSGGIGLFSEQAWFSRYPTHGAKDSAPCVVVAEPSLGSHRSKKARGEVFEPIDNCTPVHGVCARRQFEVHGGDEDEVVVVDIVDGGEGRAIERRAVYPRNDHMETLLVDGNWISGGIRDRSCSSRRSSLRDSNGRG